jgi:hypothetical protein
LVAALLRRGADISRAALDCVFGYAAGIDLTRRDLQTVARSSGWPWDMSKASTIPPIGAISPSPPSAIRRGRIALSVNGVLRQAGDLSDHLSVPDIIAALSRCRFAPGDHFHRTPRRWTAPSRRPVEGESSVSACGRKHRKISQLRRGNPAICRRVKRLRAIFRNRGCASTEPPAREALDMPVNLDPENWDEFRAESHRALDMMLDYLREIRERPVWTEPSEEARARFKRDLPQEGRDLSAVLKDFDRYIKPFATGNTHPMFMGWAQGAGTPAGMIAEMLAAGMNSNCGGRNHIAIDVERQIAAWMAQAFGFPPDASGVFVTGTSIANFLCLLVARDQAYGDKDVRLNGLCALPGQLIAYASREAHNCVRQAMELAGLGARHLRSFLLTSGAR